MQTINCGESLTFTFTPNAGYEINQVLIDGSAVEPTNSHTFSDVSIDHTIYVTFKPEIPSVTGIEDNAVQQLQIFPNTANDEIFIKSESPVKKVEIYSITGILLVVESNFVGKKSLSALPQGVYMFKVYMENGVAIRKIVKE